MLAQSIHVDAYGCNFETMINRTHIEKFLKEIVPALDLVSIQVPDFRYIQNIYRYGYNLVQLTDAAVINVAFLEKDRLLSFDMISCKTFNCAMIIEHLERFFAGKGFRT